MSINSIMVNYLFARGDKKRDKGLQKPVDIKRRDNISYGPYGKMKNASFLKAWNEVR